MKNNQEKYLDIVNQEKEILKKIRDNILNNSDSFKNGFYDISLSLLYIDSEKEKFKQITNIQNIISEILSQIAEANSIEELIELRKKLNKEINKVRKVISNIENYDESKIEDLIKSTRNNISMLYRNNKRENNLSIINKLIDKKEPLLEEEKDLLKNKLKNEKAYIKRNNLKLLSPNKKIEEFSNYKFDIKAKKEIDLSAIDFQFTESNEENCVLKNNNTQEEFDNSMINCIKVYHVLKPFEYNGTILNNIVTFFKNIPVYRNNKIALRRLCFDYDTYSHHITIEKLRDYLFDKNSFKNIVSEVFNRKFDEHKHTIEYKIHDLINKVQELNVNEQTLAIK